MKINSAMCRCCVLAVGVFFSTNHGIAQGLITLNTDDVTPLISQTRSVDVPTGQALLEFDFGFATAESPVAGGFLDAFTVTLQNPNQTATAIVFTTDPNGLVLAPVTPGTVVLDPALISLNAITYPNLQPVLPNQAAYHLSMPVPQSFLGNPMNVYFDLFNNQNVLASQAWFDNVRIAAIPEPQVCTLLLLSGSIFWSTKRRRCKTRS